MIEYEWMTNKMLISEWDDAVCDARNDAQGTPVGNIKKATLYKGGFVWRKDELKSFFIVSTYFAVQKFNQLF